MSINENETITSSAVFTDLPIPPWIRFSFMLPINIISIFCTFLQLYYMLKKPVLRKALNNHSFIILLITGLATQAIDVPLYLNYLRLGYVWPQTPALCFIWWYADVSTFEATIMLMMWASFERYVLIFHD
ncbi:unnamed protein product, partial [Rotaria sp. Silwood2]